MLAAASSLIASDWCPAQHSFHFSLFWAATHPRSHMVAPKAKETDSSGSKDPFRSHKNKKEFHQLQVCIENASRLSSDN
ncbi:hypothetical protein DPMN_132677 [Dreissena polymorpha]|uniref:Uncharacterized protein n=1 Tax=Dreissena polymorpha TaxID=45954 RepID=A0A9D4FYS5_DREPO|nr:hypothetical protein DPMN_132677 [Dreissena polymorpha]